MSHFACRQNHSILHCLILIENPSHVIRVRPQVGKILTHTSLAPDTWFPHDSDTCLHQEDVSMKWHHYSPGPRRLGSRETVWCRAATSSRPPAGCWHTRHAAGPRILTGLFQIAPTAQYTMDTAAEWNLMAQQLLASYSRAGTSSCFMEIVVLVI